MSVRSNIRAKTYFGLHRVIGSNLRSIYGEFLATQTMSRHELAQLQDQRMADLLTHAVTNVPFYHERVSSGRIALDSFPVITKETLQQSFETLMTDRLRLEYTGRKRKRPYSWVKVSTGGSTGRPTTVIHDRRAREFGRAGKLFSNWMCGFPLGTPFIMLWGSMRDIGEIRDSWTGRVVRRLMASEILNAFQMDDIHMDAHINRINASSSDHMMAYVDAADQLARYAEARGKFVKRLATVMACAGTVHASTRHNIERVFQCKVHNKYGSRECGDMACECEAGGMHIFANTVFLEIVDDRGQPQPPGNPGRILVTMLNNREFPLIRYEIGDIGTLREGACPCGSALPLLESVEGRTYETIYDTRGNRVSSVYFRHLLGVVHVRSALRRFQFVQVGKSVYQLLVEMDDKVADEDLRLMFEPVVRDLKSVLGNDATVRLMSSDRIPESSSGKFLYTRNEFHYPSRVQ